MDSKDEQDYIEGINGGIAERHQVFRVREGQRCLLKPPPGAQFAWGNMGAYSVALASEIANQALDGKAPRWAGVKVAARYVSQLDKHGSWRLPVGSVREYIESVQSGLPAVEVGR